MFVCVCSFIKAPLKTILNINSYLNNYCICMCNIFLEQSDALKFTVAGRLQKTVNSNAPSELPFERAFTKDGEGVAKKCPMEIIRNDNIEPYSSAEHKREEGGNSAENNNQKSNSKGNERSNSVDSNSDEQDADELDNIVPNNNVEGNDKRESRMKSRDFVANGRVVEVPRFNDPDTFGKFFGTLKVPSEIILTSKQSGASSDKNESSSESLKEFDDAIKPTPKLANRRNIKVPRNSKSSANCNPVKSLAARDDIVWKYTEHKSVVPFILAEKPAEPTICK